MSTSQGRRPAWWPEQTVSRDLLLLVLVAIVPLLVFTAHLAVAHYRVHRDSLRAEVTARAEVVATSAGQLAKGTHGLLVVLARLVDLRADASATNDALLALAHTDLPAHYTSLNVHGPDGGLWGTSLAVTERGPTREDRTALDRGYLHDALRTGEFVVSDPLTSRVTGGWMIVFALPVRGRSGDIEAVVTATVDVVQLQQSLDSAAALPDGSLLTVMTKGGRVLARSIEPARWIGTDIAGFAGFQLVLSGGTGTGLITGLDGVTRVSAFREVHGVPWRVYVGVPVGVAFAPLYAHLLTLAGGAAVLLALSAIAAWSVARRIRRPLTTIEEGVAILERGTLSHAVVVDGPREVRSLARGINRMAAALAERDESLRTSRREAEHARALLETILESEPACVKIVAADQRVVRMNSAGLEMCGAACLGDVEGQSVLSLIAPEDREIFEAHFARVLAGQREQVTFTLVGLDGRTRVMDSAAAPIRLAAGDHAETAYIAVTRDVTDQRAAQEERLRANRMSAVGQLTGGIAHDFNNLLTVIVAGVEHAAAATTHDDDVQEVLRLVLHAAERGADLTSGLLAFARRQPLSPRVTDVNGLVDRSLRLLTRTLGEDIAVVTEFDPHLWLAEVDPAQLETALINLSVNARDAMPDGGTLSVATSNATFAHAEAGRDDAVQPGAYVRIRIADSGTGMDAETATRVYEPFFTTKAPGKGTGLGLSMVYGFVRQSGGYITLDSQPGRGTTVSLLLPRSTGTVADEEPGLVGIVARGHGERVLVVEDDDALRALTVRTLEGLGYEVRAAADGPSALALLHADRDVDILFSDVILPGGLNGRQVAEEATRLVPTLVVLHTSGYTAGVLEQQSGRLDPDVRVVAKPWRLHELAHALRGAVNGRAAAPPDRRDGPPVHFQAEGWPSG